MNGFMTRPEEALAIHKTPYGHNSSFVQLDDGRIMQVCQGGGLCYSEDGGLTWSDLGGEDARGRGGRHVWCTRRADDGLPIGGSECSLVKLSGKNAVGLSARVSEPLEKLGATYAGDDPDVYFLFWRRPCRRNMTRRGSGDCSRGTLSVVTH